eukprot:Phypoly_transcript_07336.p1 GENE.Phypoly_transcript_07336~~Phypoly_transcript_07336.p1  ORF type:complete len:527 (+),score=108.64 Phypoly_transcript_07336:53-1633(+)
MFASNPVMEVVQKRYGVNVRSLPPIETLQPETLKDFTKEDLRCYLEAAGITPGMTKPEMKRQMRSLINQINGVEDKHRFSGQPQFPVTLPLQPLQPAFAPPVQVQYPVMAPMPPPPALTSGGSLPNFAEGDIQCSDCPKKGNKECHYKRCRTCCLRKMKELGYRCGPHLRDSDRRPTKVTNFINSQPPGTPTPGYTPPPLQRANTMPSPALASVATPTPRYPPVSSIPPTPATVVTPIQPVPTSSVPMGSQPNFALPHQPILQPPSPMEPGDVSPYSVAECPRCHKVVSTLGANLWLHLKECDPDHIMDYVRLLHEGRLATPTLTEKEKSDPIRIAHQNATHRYQQNISYLQEIFSGSSVEELIEWHAKAPSREAEQQKVLAAFTKAMEDMTGLLNKHENFLENFQRRSEKFYSHLQLLDTCASLDEVTMRAREFERELDLRAEPQPACVRVANDASRRNGFGASSEATDDGGRGRGGEKEREKEREREGEEGGAGENGKHCNSMYDKDREMVDVSEAPPLVLVAL